MMKSKTKSIFIVALSAFLLVACSNSSNEEGTSTSTETHTCASCGISFEGPCTTDVFGECVCSESCSGR